MQEPSDEELLRRSLTGFPDDFSVLVERYQHRVFGMLIRATGQRQEAEDLFQLAFTAAFAARAGFQGKSRFSTWLYAITLNQLRHWRRGKARRPAPLSLEQAPEPGVWNRILERLAGRDEERGMERVLRKLPKLEQDLLQLRYYEELDFNACAQILKISPGAARVKAHRALARMRRMLEGGEDSK